MNGLRLILLSCCLALAGASAAHSSLDQPVALKSHVVVDDSVVRLGDLFNGLTEQAKIAIARAPAPGARLQAGAHWLAEVAQAHGLRWQPRSMLDTVVIERASQVIDGERIRGELEAALVQRGIDHDFSLVLDNPAVTIYLPTDAPPSLTLAGLAYDPASGRFTASVVAPAEGAALANATVTGRVVRMIEVPVLRRRIGAGEIIGRSAIDWRRVEAGRISRTTLLDPNAMIGMSVRRGIGAGAMVRSTDLQQPVVVAKNSIVTIKLQTKRMELTAQGRALEDGAIGDLIRVMNTRSHKVIIAAVHGTSSVRVEAAY